MRSLPDSKNERLQVRLDARAKAVLRRAAEYSRKSLSQFVLSTALDEALTNACYHGNLEVRSEIRDHDARAYRVLAKERRQVAPYRDRRIHVSVTLESDAVRFVIRDDGRGFDAAAVRDPTRPDQLERPSGRGIFLMKTFLDEVRYNITGNQVTLLKLRRG